jgi:alpha-glucosidase
MGLRASEALGDGVVYQIYPRSFQDSDGDGAGDLAGITERLDHVRSLGADALWLSPVYPSPLADFGYDVSDHTAIDPVYGTLADFDALVRAAHERGLGVLMDLVACHTSIDHPWFREHPDWYVWSPVDGPPNDWVSAFGGPAWSHDERSGRWYLHSFYPEQPDLDWHNPEVVEAMQAVVRFWVDRGVDGFRIDAIDRLMKDPELRDDPRSSEPFGLWLLEHELGRDFSHSRNWHEIGKALGAIREAAGNGLLVGEVYLSGDRHASYLEHLDRTFVFELLQSSWEREAVKAAVEAGTGREGAAWVLSNHDFGRLPSRVGRPNERAAATLLLTLPGAAFVYQGDEIGVANGPGHDPPYDRIGRDSFRHPMQWEPSAGGGFTTGIPWLPIVDPGERNVAAQSRDAGSTLSYWRQLIELRRELGGPLEWVDLGERLLAYRRGPHTVAISFADEPLPLPPGEVLLASDPPEAGSLPPHAGVVVRPEPGENPAAPR